ncbi:MAG: hypothetical protein RIT28_4269 [Pseudomonadota bacterium]
MRVLHLSLLLVLLPACASELRYAKRALQEGTHAPAVRAPLSPEALYGGSAKVTLGGPVVLPLVSASPDDASPLVWVRLGEGEAAKEFLFILDPSVGLSEVSDGLIETLGLKPKQRSVDGWIGDPESPDAYVQLDGLRLAEGAVIDGLWAKTGLQRKIGGLSIDGVIGLGALPQLVGALSRTHGTLTLAPASSAEAVLSAVKGREVALSRSLGGVVTQGRVTVGYNVPTTLLVPVSLGGEDRVAALALSGSLQRGPMAELSRPLVDAATPLTRLGNQRLVQASLGLGGETMSVTALETLDLRGFAQEPYDVVLRAQITGGWDLAWDFNGGVLRLAPATRADAISPAATLDPKAPIPADRAQALKVESLLKKLAPDAETGEPPKPEALAGTHRALATVYSGLEGFESKALEHATLAQSTWPEACASEQLLGALRWSAGDAAAAARHYERAVQLYGAWIDLPRDERKQLQEAKARAEKQGETYAGPTPQDGACASARSAWAKALFAQGQHDAVLTLYAEGLNDERPRVAVDLELALLAGNVHLSRGDDRAAEAAYLQALRRDGAADPRVLLGLGLAQRSNPKTAQSALNNLSEAVWRGGGIIAVRALAQVSAAAGDPSTQLSDARALAQVVESSPIAALLVAELLARTAQDPVESATIAAARAEAGLRAGRGGDALLVSYAYALALKGDPSTARGLAEVQAKQDPASAEWLIVLAQLATAAGDAESAARYVRLAAQRAPDNPALALALRD